MFVISAQFFVDDASDSTSGADRDGRLASRS